MSELTGLEIELLTRRPLDRRSAAERQRDIRDGVASRPAAAARRLLPAYDEGIDLRVGWLDDAGRAHWEFATSSMSASGDHHLGTSGPTYREVFRFPPAFDRMSLVLAWPEIGFPETVITLPLPDRATVERASVSIWQAPLDLRPVPEGLTHHVDDRGYDSPAIETGTAVVPPQVLHRLDDRAVVVLTRLTATESVLFMELHCIAKGDAADALNDRVFVPLRQPPGAFDDLARIRARGPGASVAVIRGSEAFWIRAGDGSAYGGDQSFACSHEFTLDRPHDDLLDLIVAWPLAGLDDVRVRIPLNGAGRSPEVPRV